MNKKYIAILDFGSQYTHLISRRVRQLGVLARIFPTDVEADKIKDAWGIILSGGPDSITDERLAYDPGIFKMGVPMLGFCYGHQLIAKYLGGQVASQNQREYGKAKIKVQGNSPIFKGLEEEEQVWMSHWDIVSRMPAGFQKIGTTDICEIAAMADDNRKFYGFQYHPEVHHTTHGMKMLENFVFNICHAEKKWSMEEYFNEIKADLLNTIDNKKIFLFVSGGVDSSVVFALLEEILGKDRVFGLHVDTGFMRKNESELVKKSLADAGFDNLKVFDASDRYLMALENKYEPEEKRKIIGKIFLDVQKDVFADLNFNPDEWLLGQGTIYPDTIETGGTSASDKIKTHHNRVDEIIEMLNAGKIIEPLALLYKDEVRAIGKQLNLPEPLINRWPFPGPGLAIRCLCSDGREGEMQGRNNSEIEDIKKIDNEIKDYFEKNNKQGTRLPIKSVGVQGDLRTYQHAVVIKNGDRYDWKDLEDFAVNLVNGIQGVNRVVAHVGGNVNLDNVKIKPGYLTKERLNILRDADDVVTKIVNEHGLYNKIWQFPVIMLPLTFIGQGETIVLRPIESEEAMTVNFYHLDKNILKQMVDEILKLDGVDAVFFDITNKPPATIEWE
ncbi:MAG: glutamine-hydrolyzing GMP synthase [Patescibacteria group bacterium]